MTETTKTADDIETIEDNVESARIRQLQSDLALQGAAAITAFWEEIDAQGAPLVEPVAGNEAVRLVTFLWRESEPLDNVVLLDWFSGGDMSDKKLTKLAGSDLWYRSLEMTSDLRTDYQFMINDSLIPLREDPDLEARFRRALLDPRNPKHIVQPWMSVAEKDAPRANGSILELPDAVPFVWKGLRDVPHGAVTTRKFASTVLGNERDIWIYTYPGYEQATDEAMLLIQFDGDQCLGVLDVPNLLDNLQSEAKIRPTIGVFVGNVDRGNELPCNERFANFLADELIPWVRSEYRIAPGPESVIASGQSYGGLASAWIGLTRPDAVGNVLSQSGSFWWLPEPEGIRQKQPIGAAPACGWLPQQVAAASWDRVPTRFHMEAGTLEARNDGVVPSLLSTNRHMRDVLIARGYEVHYSEYAGGHDWFIWAEMLAGGLLHLIPAHE